MLMNIFSFLGIGNAFADTATTVAAAPKPGQGILSLLPMLAILILFMYFMVFRPQSKRAKDHRNLVSNLKEGDEVATIGGILGTIKKMSDTYIVLTIAEGADITVQKNAIANSLPKGTIQSVK